MSKSKPEDDSPIEPIPIQNGEIIDPNDHHDAVFGEMVEGGPNYRNVGWLGTAALMIKTQIGLGVLSIPAVFDTLGMIPGIILLLLVGIITTWSNYMVGVFKVNHRHVYGIDDVGDMLFGRIGREVFGTVFCLFFTFVSGSAMLSISISLNALSTHAICTAIFVAIAAILTFALSSIQTLGRISWLAWIGGSCILIAVFTVTFAVGLQDRPPGAPLASGSDSEWQSDYKLINNPTLAEASSAIASLVFAYCGTPAFFNIASEMRDPRQYNKALIVCQTVITIAYLVVGIVVYYYAGSYVSSPALGTAGPVLKKVGYGIALPGLVVSAVLLNHIPSKYIFIRILRGSPHLTKNTTTHWLVWLGSTLTISLAAYIIASGIPVFDSLVSLVGAVFGTFLSFQPMGCMWLYDNWSWNQSGTSEADLGQGLGLGLRDSNLNSKKKTLAWRGMVAWCVFVIVSGTFIMVAGGYGAIVGIVDSFRESDGGSAAWSCADNSNST